MLLESASFELLVPQAARTYPDIGLGALETYVRWGLDTGSGGAPEIEA